MSFIIVLITEIHVFIKLFRSILIFTFRRMKHLFVWVFHVLFKIDLAIYRTWVVNVRDCRVFTVHWLQACLFLLLFEITFLKLFNRSYVFWASHCVGKYYALFYLLQYNLFYKKHFFFTFITFLQCPWSR